MTVERTVEKLTEMLMGLILMHYCRFIKIATSQDCYAPPAAMACSHP